jgi:hypothetical protein
MPSRVSLVPARAPAALTEAEQSVFIEFFRLIFLPVHVWCAIIWLAIYMASLFSGEPNA